VIGRRRFRRAGVLAPGVALAFALAAPAGATEYIARAQWPDIQRGIQVTQYPKLAAVVNEFDRRADAVIVILYPGGEAGYNWATEIRDWLVALGVPGGRVAMRPGSGVPGSIGLQVEERGAS